MVSEVRRSSPDLRDLRPNHLAQMVVVVVVRGRFGHSGRQLLVMNNRNGVCTAGTTTETSLNCTLVSLALVRATLSREVLQVAT